jgi:orotidine-5'-phosphate decarboxylase
LTTGSRIIVALDYPDAKSALVLTDRLQPSACRLKIGKELFTAAGPQFVVMLAKRGFDIFLDLKFHDIPNTVAQACRAAASLGAWMLNVHALGGREMMQAARDAIGTASDRPWLIAVTVLTSMGEQDLHEVGIDAKPLDQALRLAALAKACRLDGVVCAAHEAGAIRSQLGEGFLRVSPGIRLSGGSPDDQKRVMTPRQAFEAGASYLVIGRPVTRAAQPLEVLERINSEMTTQGSDK